MADSLLIMIYIQTTIKNKWWERVWCLICPSTIYQKWVYLGSNFSSLLVVDHDSLLFTKFFKKCSA